MELNPATGNKRHQIVNSSFWVGLDTLTGIVFAFICSVLVARVMGPTVLGYYNFVLWIAALTFQLGTLGIPSATRKYAAELRGRGDLAGARAVVVATARFQMVLASVVCVVGSVIIFVVSGPQHRVYALLVLLSVGPSMMMSIYASGLTAAEDFASQVSSSITSSLVNVCGVIMTLVFHWGLIGLASSLLTGRIVDFVLRRRLYIRKIGAVEGADPANEHLSPELRQRMIRFCMYSTGLLLLSAIVWDRSEVFFLKWFCNIKEVAFYSVGFNLVQQMTIFPRMFTSPSSARLMVEFGQDRRMSAQVAEITARYLALFALPVMLGMAAISGPLLRVVYGTAYSPAGPVLAIAASLAIARAFIAPADQLMIANERQNTLLKWGVFCAVLNLTLDLLLIRAHGAIGAAIANGIAQFVSAVGSWTLAFRFCGAKFPVRSTGKLLVAALVMAAGAAVCSATMPPAITLGVGVPISMALFVLCMRLLHPFDARDRSRLMLAAKLLPGPGARLYAKVLSFAIPEKHEAMATAV